MQIRLVLAFLLAWAPITLAQSNRVSNFAIQHCVGLECMVARSPMAFMNYSGRKISARKVTMEVHASGRQQIYLCEDFRGDLISGFFICDNRETQRLSLTIDDQMKITRY